MQDCYQELQGFSHWVAQSPPEFTRFRDLLINRRHSLNNFFVSKGGALMVGAKRCQRKLSSPETRSRNFCRQKLCNRKSKNRIVEFFP